MRLQEAVTTQREAFRRDGVTLNVVAVPSAAALHSASVPTTFTLVQVKMNAFRPQFPLERAELEALVSVIAGGILGQDLSVCLRNQSLLEARSEFANVYPCHDDGKNDDRRQYFLIRVPRHLYSVGPSRIPGRQAAALHGMARMQAALADFKARLASVRARLDEVDRLCREIVDVRVTAGSAQGGATILPPPTQAARLASGNGAIPAPPSSFAALPPTVGPAANVVSLEDARRKLARDREG